MVRKIPRLLASLLVIVLTADAFVAWDVFYNEGRLFGSPQAASSSPTTDTPPAESDISGRDGEFSYSAVQIFTDQGRFSGQATIRNDSSIVADVYVKVSVFAGDQNVAQLNGNVTLKPGTESSVDLTGNDDYVDWTDVHVSLLGLPD